MYTDSAEKGFTLAMMKLGEIYRFGKGVAKDYDKAIDWYTKAANAGDSYSETAKKAIEAIAGERASGSGTNTNTSSGQGTSTNSGCCYIATAVYGSYDCPEVWTLRRFRDNTLASTWYGRAFIRVYYATSPTLIKWFGHTKWFNSFWRNHLDRMVRRLQNEGFESTPYVDP